MDIEKRIKRAVKAAVKKRDAEWLENLWPRSAGTFIGELCAKPKGAGRFLRAAEELRAEDVAWIAKQQKKWENAEAKIHAVKAAIAKYASSKGEMFSGYDVSTEIRSCLRYPDSWKRTAPPNEARRDKEDQ